MDVTGLEPVTPSMSTMYSNQLSYTSAQVFTITQDLPKTQINKQTYIDFLKRWGSRGHWGV